MDEEDLAMLGYMADVFDVGINAASPFWEEPANNTGFRNQDRIYYIIRRENPLPAEGYPGPSLEENPSIKGYIVHTHPNACELGFKAVRSESPAVQAALARLGVVYRFDGAKDQPVVAATQAPVAGMEMKAVGYPREFPQYFPSEFFYHEDFHTFQLEGWAPTIELSGYNVRVRVTEEELALHVLWARVVAEALLANTPEATERALKTVLAIRLARESACTELQPDLFGRPNRFHYLAVQDKNLLWEGTAQYVGVRYMLEPNAAWPSYLQTLESFAAYYVNQVESVFDDTYPAGVPQDLTDAYYYFVLSYWHGAALGLLLDRVPGLDWKSPSGLPLTEPDAMGRQILPGAVQNQLKARYATVPTSELTTLLSEAKAMHGHDMVLARASLFRQAFPAVFCSAQSPQFCCNNTYAP